ncbi:TPA: hypothetical protein ACSPMB_000004 [Pseudomonas aeruginosa]
MSTPALGARQVICEWIPVEQNVPTIPQNWIRTEEVFLVNAGGMTIPAHFVAGMPGSAADRWDFRPEVQHNRHWIKACESGNTQDLIIEAVLEWMRLPLRSQHLQGKNLNLKTFTDTEILSFLERHNTLHKKVEILYVVDGYEAAVTWDDAPISDVFKGKDLREALVQMMQAGDIFSPDGR